MQFLVGLENQMKRLDGVIGRCGRKHHKMVSLNSAKVAFAVRRISKVWKYKQREMRANAPER